MSSIICQNFVQNAWKKELCSNCFKSKDEHKSLSNNNNSNNNNSHIRNSNLNQKTTISSSIITPRPTTTTFAKNAANLQRNKMSDNSAMDAKTKSIIKPKGGSSTKAKRTVNFKSNLAQVIGYGGEDWSEEEEDVVALEESNEADSPSEDEAELLRLTKVNTDFNANLTCKKLQLGKPQVDAEGRKQTLLVQVTPFGQDSPAGAATKRVFKFPHNKPDDNLTKTYGVKDEKFKEVTEEINDPRTTIDETRDKVEEKSLLDEITETLEKSKNPIVKKIVQKEIILSKPIITSASPASKVTGPPVKLNRNPAIKEKKTYQSTKSVNLAPIIQKSDSKEVKDEKDPFDDKDSANGGSSLDDSSSHCGSEDSNSTDQTDSSLDAKPTHYQNVVGDIPIPSRELVGEPDGRAESDGTDEPIPALPATPPPPIPTQPPTTPINNLGMEKSKPKVPTKPSTILIRKPPSLMSVNTTTVNQVILSTFNSEKSPKIHTTLQKQDSNGSDISKKRKAPKPPNDDSTNSSIYTRKPVQIANTDCPVVREKEKRERASSCTPKANLTRESPEPAPRRSLSLSSDSLASGGSDEKKKRGKFSLKKLLRMGTSSSTSSKSSETVEEKPQPKPRLVIVHPLDLKAKEEQQIEQEYVNTSFIKEQILLQQPDKYEVVVQSRPPPPPRNYENYELKPEKLPPKTTQIKHLQTAVKNNPLPSGKGKETVYANIGEVRNAITPNKPQRTASMREIKEGIVRNVYEPVSNPMPGKLIDGNIKGGIKHEADHVYDYIGNRSSSPECDSTAKKSSEVHGASGAKLAGMSRSVSLTYCGSETESEIYSPYSYYGSESEVAEDDQECCYGNGLGSTGRTHKLRSKKGRSIVHKNLEDNYGAVVIANHEALAQVLENIQQTVHVPLPLRALKTAENLRWNDFQLRASSQLASGGTASLNTTTSPSHTAIIGNCSFHQASWNLQNVTLMITIVPNSPSLSVGAFNLQPVTEFSDLVPCTYVCHQQKATSGKDDLPIQATISVLPCMQISSIASMGECLHANKTEDTHRCSILILLQLVNGLKALQAQGVEELPASLNSFVLAKEVEKQEVYARLYFMQPLEEARNAMETGTLCVIVAKVLKLLPVEANLQRLIQALLSSERAVTLSQVKSVLEFSLWGPSDIALGSTSQEREFVLQRWLDLQRATVLHGLVCAKVQLTVYEECHLLFLVRSNAKMMCDASLLLESVR